MINVLRLLQSFCMIVFFLRQPGVENSPIFIPEPEQISQKPENLCFIPDLKEGGK